MWKGVENNFWNMRIIDESSIDGILNEQKTLLYIRRVLRNVKKIK
jgi:hypothetical protein